MAQTLQINIDNHRYQLVSSMADGLYLVEINYQRRLIILLCVLLFLLAGYLLQLLTGYNFNSLGTEHTEVNQPASAEPVERMVREKHINLNAEIPVNSSQHAVYLYYERFNVLDTFLPAQAEQ